MIGEKAVEEMSQQTKYHDNYKKEDKCLRLDNNNP